MSKSKPKISQSKRKLDKTIIVALIGLVGTLIAAMIAISPSIIELFSKALAAATVEPFPTATEVFSQQSFPDSTLIPRIDKILEINFSPGDSTTCITEDPKLGGYDQSQDNYFVIGKRNGYIAYCNISNHVNQGSLEIKADPVGSPDYFGYGIIIGFVGGTSRDQCSFEIKKDGTETTFAFGEYIEGSFSKPSEKLNNYSLDTSPHTLRMVLDSEGNAIVYVDDAKIAEHKFIGCSTGRIGFIAYGLGDTKIVFDDLKLYAVP